MRARTVALLITVGLAGCSDTTPGSHAGTAVTPSSDVTDATPVPTSATFVVTSVEPTAPPDLDEKSYNMNEPAAMDDLVGRWSDGVNTFAFSDDGVLTFTLDQSCDGTYALGAHGELDVSFGACDHSSVWLSAPIFRQATVYRGGDSLYLDGDAGVFRLDEVSEP